MNIAEYIKDYQTLIASLIAFGAAFVAFISAQSVAQSQRTTSLELARNAEARKNLAKKEADLKRRLALLLELRSDVDVVRRINAYRIKMGEMLQAKLVNIGSEEGDASRIEYTQFQFAWENLMRSLGRMSQLLFVRIKFGDLGIFDAQTQRNVHFLASSIHHSENTLKDLNDDINIRNPRFFLGIEVRNLISASEILSGAEAHLRSYLQGEIDKVGNQLAD